MAVGSGGEWKSIKRQLAATIEAGEISILDKNGEGITAESLFEQTAPPSNRLNAEPDASLCVRFAQPPVFIRPQPGSSR